MVKGINPHAERASSMAGVMISLIGIRPRSPVGLEDSGHHTRNRDGSHADMKLLLSCAEISHDGIEIQLLSGRRFPGVWQKKS